MSDAIVSWVQGHKFPAGIIITVVITIVATVVFGIANALRTDTAKEAEASGIEQGDPL